MQTGLLQYAGPDYSSAALAGDLYRPLAFVDPTNVAASVVDADTLQGNKFPPCRVLPFILLHVCLFVSL